MNILKYSTNGREYEIRSLQTPEGWEVATFYGDKRVSPRYKVSFETEQDFRHYHGEHAVDKLVELAKADLDTGSVK